MGLADLDEREREVAQECLHAVVDGPFFPEWEFATLFGLERDEVRRILFTWPGLDETDDSVVLAINNSFNNLLGYPGEDKEAKWAEFISADEAEVARIFDKWRGRGTPISRSKRDYFENIM